MVNVYVGGMSWLAVGRRRYDVRTGSGMLRAFEQVVSPAAIKSEKDLIMGIRQIGGGNIHYFYTLLRWMYSDLCIRNVRAVLRLALITQALR